MYGVSIAPIATFLVQAFVAIARQPDESRAIFVDPLFITVACSAHVTLPKVDGIAVAGVAFFFVNTHGLVYRQANFFGVPRSDSKQ